MIDPDKMLLDIQRVIDSKSMRRERIKHWITVSSVFITTPLRNILGGREKPMEILGTSVPEVFASMSEEQRENLITMLGMAYVHIMEQIAFGDNDADSPAP